MNPMTRGRSVDAKAYRRMRNEDDDEPPPSSAKQQQQGQQQGQMVKSSSSSSSGGGGRLLGFRFRKGGGGGGRKHGSSSSSNESTQQQQQQQAAAAAAAAHAATDESHGESNSSASRGSRSRSSRGSSRGSKSGSGSRGSGGNSKRITPSTNESLPTPWKQQPPKPQSILKTSSTTSRSLYESTSNSNNRFVPDYNLVGIRSSLYQDRYTTQSPHQQHQHNSNPRMHGDSSSSPNYASSSLQPNAQFVHRHHHHHQHHQHPRTAPKGLSFSTTRDSTRVGSSGQKQQQQQQQQQHPSSLRGSRYHSSHTEESWARSHGGGQGPQQYGQTTGPAMAMNPDLLRRRRRPQGQQQQPQQHMSGDNDPTSGIVPNDPQSTRQKGEEERVMMRRQKQPPQQLLATTMTTATTATTSLDETGSTSTYQSNEAVETIVTKPQWKPTPTPTTPSSTTSSYANPQLHHYRRRRDSASTKGDRTTTTATTTTDTTFLRASFSSASMAHRSSITSAMTSSIASVQDILANMVDPNTGAYVNTNKRIQPPPSSASSITTSATTTTNTGVSLPLHHHHNHHQNAYTTAAATVATATTATSTTGTVNSVRTGQPPTETTIRTGQGAATSSSPVEDEELTLQSDMSPMVVVPRPRSHPISTSMGAGETEEDRMIRLAMEVSLRTFEEQQRLDVAVHQQRQLQHPESLLMHQQQELQQQQQQQEHQQEDDNNERMLRDALNVYYRQSSSRSLRSADAVARVMEESAFMSAFPARQSTTPVVSSQIETARQNLSAEEAALIETALKEAEDALEGINNSSDAMMAVNDVTSDALEAPSSEPDYPALTAAVVASSSLEPTPPSTLLSPVGGGDHGSSVLASDEVEAIHRAIREADERENERSFNLALQLQTEEADRLGDDRPWTNTSQATVGTGEGQMVGAYRSSSPPRLHSLELQQEERAQQASGPPRNAGEGGQMVGAYRSSSPPRRHSLELQEEGDRVQQTGRQRSLHRHQTPEQRHAGVFASQNDGVQQSDQAPSHHRAPLPPAEVQSELEQSNAQRLGEEADEDIAFVGNIAYNAFKQPMHRRRSSAASSGSGRDVMDSSVRLQINGAMNNKIIGMCNGVVKEGREAVVFHADRGLRSFGYDVAIKVFRRTTVGDHHHQGDELARAELKEELEMWASREYRNLIRASRARVPIPSPLQHRETMVFMRFMGEHGWPAPQLRDLGLRKGNKQWSLLYSQVMVAVRRLFVGAQLVHGDLGAYNILVCPAHLVENRDEGMGEDNNNNNNNSSSSNEDAVQAVLIDFCQAVDVRHPDAMNRLVRDLARIRSFFHKQGIKTLGPTMALEFVTAPEPDDDEEEYEESVGGEPTTESR